MIDQQAEKDGTQSTRPARIHGLSGRRKPTRDGLEIINRLFFDGRPVKMVELEVARLTAAIAREAYDMREAAGLGCSRLARKVGTTADVIRRLEDDDYDDENGIAMLQRIASALGRRVEIRVLPEKARKRPA